MQKRFRTLIPAAFLLLSLGASPQAMKIDHWSPAQLLERAQHLRQLAAQGDGSASQTLEKYPHHYTMLAFRSRDGEENCTRTMPTFFTSSMVMRR